MPRKTFQTVALPEKRKFFDNLANHPPVYFNKILRQPRQHLLPDKSNLCAVCVVNMQFFTPCEYFAFNSKKIAAVFVFGEKNGRAMKTPVV